MKTTASFFSNDQIDLEILRERAHNLRWATLPKGTIALTAADPDFPIATEIREAISDYVSSGYLSYGPAEGLESFRRTVAQTMRDRRGIDCTYEQVLATNGAGFAMYLAAKFALSPGDEAIIFNPMDFLFRTSVEAVEGIPVSYDVAFGEETIDFDRLKSLVSDKTRLLCLCNPFNPIGKVFTYDELKQLGEFALEHDLWILSDEIWSDIVFAPHEYVSIASISEEIRERTLTVYGFSKSFGLAGLRIGFLLSPSKEIHQKVVELSKVNTTIFGASTLSQIAAEAAFAHCWYWVEAFQDHLRKLRDYSVQRLILMDGVECLGPEGTYLLFPKISSFGLSSQEMADYLMKYARVAVVPGASQWLGSNAEGHVRMCFSTSREILEEGLNRIELALMKLRVES